MMRKETKIGASGVKSGKVIRGLNERPHSLRARLQGDDEGSSYQSTEAF